MNLSTSSSSANKDSKLSSSNKITLNPDAAEFIPFALRSTTPTTTKFSQLVKPDSPVSLGKSVLDKSESSVSNNSDDEIHQYWRCQLPDDITPDFKSISEEELHVPESLSMAALSMYDGAEVSRFSSGTLVRKNQEIDEQVIYSVPTYFEEQSGSSFMTMSTDHWDKQLRNGTHQLQEELSYKNDMSTDFINGVLPEHPSEDVNEGNPIEYLAPLFPGFAADSLAEVYYANQGDLNSTIEMLTQLELQFDGGFNQSLTSKTSAPPNLNSVEFPALPDPQNGLAKYCGDDIQQTSSAYQPLNGEFGFLNSNSPGISKGPIDFVSAVRKLASQGSGKWQYEGNNSLDVSTGTSTRRSSLNLGNSYNGNTRSVHGEKLQNYAGVGRTAPVWLETGEAVANLYSELREEARDHARLRNAYLEQARQAYLIGNKALAKELSVKGQLHNMKMKAAHEQAKESIYRHRNPVAVNGQSHSRGQERMIDLHGLHVSEAIRVLKNEIGLLRTVSRSTGQRIQVLICVGTGHHTKGTRTPARLPVAVEQYLLEEGLHFSETLPGLLRVVIY